MCIDNNCFETESWDDYMYVSTIINKKSKYSCREELHALQIHVNEVQAIDTVPFLFLQQDKNLQNVQYVGRPLGSWPHFKQDCWETY